jgi:hypothetical protein
MCELAYLLGGKNMRAPEVVFTGGTDTGTITCRQCGKTKTLDISHFKNVRKLVKVKCTCGTLFDVLFESRRYHRKKVQLKGELFNAKSHDIIDHVIITDISVGGISFITKLGMTVGEVYRISFSLDGQNEADIKEEIRIKYVKNREVGAEFTEEEKYNYDLDFYLTPFSIVD